jgi:hypothetical protein
MYNDQSANEALSLSIGFKILQSPYCNLFANMRRDDYFYLRRCAPAATNRACCMCANLPSARAGWHCRRQRARPRRERVHANRTLSSRALDLASNVREAAGERPGADEARALVTERHAPAPS